MWLLRDAVFRLCGARQNFYLFSLYRNPDIDDRIDEYLLTAMAAVQAVDVNLEWLSVWNGHHQDWLGTTTTNRQGIAT